jgi:phosphatidylserine/phosphatidylglycerophosphate/cardiolipin synthase-like enzyme
VAEIPPSPETPMFLVPKGAAVEERPPRNARYFAPLFIRKRLRIQPLLTPDNFIDHVLPLVESATESIDLQNQTLKWGHKNVDERFEQLMNTASQGIVRVNSFTLPQRQNRISRPLIFLHFSGSI